MQDDLKLSNQKYRIIKWDMWDCDTNSHVVSKKYSKKEKENTYDRPKNTKNNNLDEKSTWMPHMNHLTMITTIETNLWDIQVEIFILDPGTSMQDDTNFEILDMWGHRTDIWHS